MKIRGIRVCYVCLDPKQPTLFRLQTIRKERRAKKPHIYLLIAYRYLRIAGMSKVKGLVPHLHTRYLVLTDVLVPFEKVLSDHGSKLYRILMNHGYTLLSFFLFFFSRLLIRNF